MNPSANSVKSGLSELAKWVRYRSAAYLCGRGVLYGVDAEIYPFAAVAPQKFALYADVVKHPRVDVFDVDLSVVANDSLDFVLLGRRFVEGPRRAEDYLREATAKLKRGGHLIVNYPLSNKASFTTNKIKDTLSKASSWKVKDRWDKDDWVIEIYRKISGSKSMVEMTRSRKPRACICRYGALGDAIILTPLVRELAQTGYEVTLNITPYAAPIFENNPYVHNIIHQEREIIPNSELGPYWDTWKADYDRYINLSESLEGRLLKVEGRRDYFTTAEWRRGICNKNYYDWTLELGGFPEVRGTRGELFFTAKEERDVKEVLGNSKSKFRVVWALNGSSYHKVYGLFKPVVSDWLDRHPDARVFTVGDQVAQQFEFDHPQVTRLAGQLPLRMSLGLTKWADLVVGPETMITNSAGCFDTPKIVFLSHSSEENLTKYWTNCQALKPNLEIAPCYPCHQLHYNLNSCPIASIIDSNGNEITKGPRCAMGAISGEALTDAMNKVYGQFISKS